VGSGWAEQGHPDRLPATCHRTHGVRHFHGCYPVGDDCLWGANRRRKSAANTLAALKSIRAGRPDGAPTYVITDHLSAHTGADIRRWSRKNKVVLCFTPTYACGRIRSRPASGRCGSSSSPTRTTLTTRCRSVPARLPALVQRQRDVLAAERKERARIRSEKGIRWGGLPLVAAA
jgi:hypothetical protein